MFHRTCHTTLVHLLIYDNSTNCLMNMCNVILLFGFLRHKSGRSSNKIDII